MCKNQLQELAQRSRFNLPSYWCIREGPGHAPRFKATVNFNGETFDSPGFCSTLRQAEHSAAEVALIALSNRGPSHSLAARIMNESGIYKNLLQQIAHRVGAPLPVYTTFCSGHGHQSIFISEVELAGITFAGEPATSKKQAEKNAATAAWSSLKQLAQQTASSSSETETIDEHEQITIARALLSYLLDEKIAKATENMSNTTVSSPKQFPIQDQKPPTTHSLAATGSKILPFLRPRHSPRNRPSPATRAMATAAGAAPYVPVLSRAPPVTIRTAVPVYAAPPLPSPPCRPTSLVPVGPAASVLHVGHQ